MIDRYHNHLNDQLVLSIVVSRPLLYARMQTQISEGVSYQLHATKVSRCTGICHRLLTWQWHVFHLICPRTQLYFPRQLLLRLNGSRNGLIAYWDPAGTSPDPSSLPLPSLELLSQMSVNSTLQTYGWLDCDKEPRRCNGVPMIADKHSTHPPSSSC